MIERLVHALGLSQAAGAAEALHRHAVGIDEHEGLHARVLRAPVALEGAAGRLGRAHEQHGGVGPQVMEVSGGRALIPVLGQRDAQRRRYLVSRAGPLPRRDDAVQRLVRIPQAQRQQLAGRGPRRPLLRARRLPHSSPFPHVRPRNNGPSLVIVIISQPFATIKAARPAQQAESPPRPPPNARGPATAAGPRRPCGQDDRRRGAERLAGSGAAPGG